MRLVPIVDAVCVWALASCHPVMVYCVLLCDECVSMCVYAHGVCEKVHGKLII